MKEFIVYHNPNCSKSRQILQILQSCHINPTIVEYLKTPLNIEQLLELRSHFDLKDFVRTNEPVFKNLGLVLEDEAKILEVMLKEPILMQRPIVTCNGQAIIARPPEKIWELLKPSQAFSK
ncbi:ArsC/Spx/MgsR family protein [Legionella septentrionalis]|uniref:Arsenate reductase (Glutaredoxin) n=1 Tax=Legionella septentrionalis TaxID=2498109 RepID=A0A3S0XRT6_9GAMM|nr:ArsC/Spx/MgsR family protein [Legionella septentrionalis]RUQ79568.1 arsenate reductase (glutaredoxin) [Legionella septentrionalis]